MQLVQLVATEVFDSALGVAQDMDPDLLKVSLSGAQPSIREDTWPEVRLTEGQCLSLNVLRYGVLNH